MPLLLNRYRAAAGGGIELVAASHQASKQDNLSSDFDVVAGTNRLFLVIPMIKSDSFANLPSTMTLGGNSLTKYNVSPYTHSTSEGEVSADIWILKEADFPAVGNQTLTVGGAGSVTAGMFQFENVLQATPIKAVLDVGWDTAMTDFDTDFTLGDVAIGDPVAAYHVCQSNRNLDQMTADPAAAWTEIANGNTGSNAFYGEANADPFLTNWDDFLTFINNACLSIVVGISGTRDT